MNQKSLKSVCLRLTDKFLKRDPKLFEPLFQALFGNGQRDHYSGVAPANQSKDRAFLKEGGDLNPGERHSRDTRDDGTVTL